MTDRNWNCFYKISNIEWAHMEEYLSLKEWSFPLTWWFELNELQPVPNPVVFCRITEKGTLKAWWFWTKLLHNYWCLLGCPEYQVVGIHSQPHARAVLQSKWPSMSPKKINKWNYNKTIKICEKSALLGWSGNFVFTFSVGVCKGDRAELHSLWILKDSRRNYKHAYM